MNIKEIDAAKQESLRMLEGNSWLARKVDRTRRLLEIRRYVERRLPEMKARPLEGFLDLGPGPGELIEIAMAHSMDAYGWDAKTPDGGMGNDYLRFSALEHKVRGLEVTYNNSIEGVCVKFSHALSIINSRGSLEQILASCMNGEPHDVHHDCRQLAWDEQRGQVGLEKFMKTMRASLTDNGILMIAANGASNTEWYDSVVSGIAKVAGFSRCERFNDRTHKFYVTE